MESNEMDKFKADVLQKATDALDKFNNIGCSSISCTKCIYFHDCYCYIANIRDSLTKVIKISEIKNPQYVIIHSGDIIYGPASEEDCVSMAKNLKNTVITKFQITTIKHYF